MAIRVGFRLGLALTALLALAPLGICQDSVPANLYYGIMSYGPGCKVYSLAEVGDDAALCKWIADTIPQMIQPGSWTGVDGKAKLSYFAPGKVLVINHSPVVHAQVDEFLHSVKKSLPPAKAAKRDASVMQAQFTPPTAPDVGPAVTPAQAYPVPYPPQTPKHLFHFIIRYEGEGIIDSNVAKFAKALAAQNAMMNSSAGVSMTPGEPTPEAVYSQSGVSPMSTFPAPAYLRHPPQYFPPNCPPGSVCPTPWGGVRPMPLADAPLSPAGNVPPPPPYPGPVPPPSRVPSTSSQ